MAVTSLLAFEVARFFATRPTLEQIIAFHPSPEAAERYYALVDGERAGALSDEEQGELDGAVQIEYMIDLLKVEARKQLKQMAS